MSFRRDTENHERRLTPVALVQLENEVFENLRPKFEVTLTHSEVKNISLLSFSMLVTDVGDGFGLFGHQHPLSSYINIGHQDEIDVTNIEIQSPTSSNSHQL